jgi:cationic peptide transport system permease protein
MFLIILRKIILFLCSVIVLLGLTFWFHVRVKNLGDSNLFDELMIYLNRICSLDFGISSESGHKVLNEFIPAMIASSELVVISIVISAVVGLLFGSYSALHKDTILDSMVTNTSIFFSAIPVFWLAQILISVISVYFDIIPSQHRISPLYDVPNVTGLILVDTLLISGEDNFSSFFNALMHFPLPVIALSILPVTEFIRITRNSLYGVMQQNYIKIAFSRGRSPYFIILHHAIRNALPKIFQQSSSIIFLTFTSVIVVENAFNWPGIGMMIIQAIKNNDYNIVSIYLLFVGILFIFLNLMLEALAEFFQYFKSGGVKING